MTSAAIWSKDNPIEFGLFGLARQGDMPEWVKMDRDKTILHLGPGSKVIPGAVDIAYPEFDFSDPNLHLPYGGGTVGGAVATHVLEHLQDPKILMREVARVLAPGCPFNVLVPHGQSIMFMQDLDHKKPFVIDTWRTLLSNQYYDNMYGDQTIDFTIGANFKFAVKEGNETVITQLIKKAR